MTTRQAYVAGKFYPGTDYEITKLLDSVYAKEKTKFTKKLKPSYIIGGIVPHAGYIYSAYEAMHFFEILKQNEQYFETVIIVHPNHSGYGPDLAFDSNDVWETPLGEMLIDKDFYETMNIEIFEAAHSREHSAEVMLPFLQYYLPGDYKILPIAITDQNPKIAKDLANMLFEAKQKLKKEILIIASSDFSHFVEPAHGQRMDDLVIKQILNFNTEEVYNEVRTKRISVCGYGPIMSLMEYSKLIDDNPKVDILARGNSGKNSLSYDVVDYVSVLFYLE